MARPQVSKDTVRVDGLADLRRELKRLGGTNFTNELKQANYDVASLVAERGKRAGRATGRKNVARAANTLRPMKQAAKAVVAMGSKDTPWAHAAEFGTKHNVPRHVQPRTVTTFRAGGAGGGETRTERTTRGGTVLGWNQHAPWRGNGEQAGYFLWPTIRESADEIREQYEDALLKMTGKAFPHRTR